MNQQHEADPPVLWRPTATAESGSTLAKFTEWLRVRRGLHAADYGQLYDWSVRDLSGFWGAVADFFDVRFHAPPRQVVSDDTMPDTVWFEGATLNYAEHALRAGPGKADGDSAVIAVNELGDTERLSFGQLREAVASVQRGLRDLG
ncbi:MAG: acetyl-coenzyme A synthetase N-terminal domain-containing protein, partial [Steroidobacteraceae bacterium]